MIGFHFSHFDPASGKSKFEQLLDLFMQLLTYTNGDVGEALQWLNQLDREYQMTDSEYGMGDFIDELKDKGYITEKEETGEIRITPKTEQGIRKRSLEEIFGKPFTNHMSKRPAAFTVHWITATCTMPVMIQPITKAQIAPLRV